MFEHRDLYEEMILEHNRNPRNYPNKPNACSHNGHGFNPLCGDEFDLHLQIKDGVIKDIGFEGAGCAISTASASMMTDAVKGLSIQQARDLFAKVYPMLNGTDSQQLEFDDLYQQLGKIAILAGVKDYPIRVKCATLAWRILLGALDQETTTICTE